MVTSRTRVLCRSFILAAVGAGGLAHAQVGHTVISVKVSHVVGTTTYPAAAGDGVTDDTLAIQGAIYYAGASSTNRAGNGAVIYFPEGTYRVTSQITVPPYGGLDFAGASPNDFTSTIPPSVIVGDFTTATNPLFFSETQCSVWTHLVIAGRLTTSSAAPLALYQTASTDGCVARVTFEHSRFYSSWPDTSGTSPAPIGTAFSLGAGASDNCNCNFSFYDCGFTQFKSCVTVNTDQGLDYIFEQVGVSDCYTFLDLPHGGNVSFNTGTFTKCGHVDTSGSPDYWVFNLGDGGPNNGTIKIQNAHFEMDSHAFINVNGQQQVVVEGLDENGPGFNAPVLQVGSGTVTFASCRFTSYPVLSLLTPIYWIDGTVRFRDSSFELTPPGSSRPTLPTVPAVPPSGLITGTGKHIFLQCVGNYDTGLGYPKIGYPMQNYTNVTGW